MALENITSGAAHTIADLDPANPGGGDQVAQGDDHIRNIKHAIQLTWPNLSDTCSGVASEFAFAHKGGTVSGSAVIKGDVHIQGSASIAGALTVDGSASFSGNVTLAGTLSVSGHTVLKNGLEVNSTSTASGTVVFNVKSTIITGRLAVSATISGSIAEAAFARSASYAISALRATSASAAGRAVSASRALNATFATSAGFAHSASIATSAIHAASASYALSALRAVSASRALNATFATSAGRAASASYAISALRAVSASNAGFAKSASQAIQNHDTHVFSLWISGGTSVKYQSTGVTWSTRGTGRYTLSHNLGSSSIMIQVTPFGTDAELRHLGGISNNFANYVNYYLQSAGVDANFNHMVTLFVRL